MISVAALEDALKWPIRYQLLLQPAATAGNSSPAARFSAELCGCRLAIDAGVRAIAIS
jgi:hypothetical protein